MILKKKPCQSGCRHWHILNVSSSNMGFAFEDQNF